MPFRVGRFGTVARTNLPARQGISLLRRAQHLTPIGGSRLRDTWLALGLRYASPDSSGTLGAWWPSTVDLCRRRLEPRPDLWLEAPPGRRGLWPAAPAGSRHLRQVQVREGHLHLGHLVGGRCE